MPPPTTNEDSSATTRVIRRLFSRPRTGTPLRQALALLALALALAMVLAGCTAMPASPSPSPFAAADPVFRCEQGVDFSARLSDDAAVLKGRWGQALLLRDAGGLAPGQRVFSNHEMRAEFGLGANAREAVLHALVPDSAASPPRALRCQQQ